MPIGGRRPGAGRPKGSKTRPLDVRLAEKRSKREPRPPVSLDRTCLVCDVRFVRPGAKQGLPLKYCSAECRDVGYRYGDERPCPTCGNMFRPKKWSGQQVCSMSCRRHPEARIYPSRKEKVSASDDRRRAQKFGAGYERFWRRSIYERDGWICGICGLPVDRSEQPDMHLRPSLDHVVPLSKGGAHSRSNVQCAHWICNSRKTHSLDGGGCAALKMKAEYATRWSEARSRAQAGSE
jgi:5-methylcytosine-specific restriction endonuclease McrA